MHRTLKRILLILCLEAIPHWEKILPQALFALRTVIHDSNGSSPAELVHGKNLRSHVMLLYEKLTEEEPVESSVVDYVFELINSTKRCQELAILYMEDAKQKQKLCMIVGSLSVNFNRVNWFWSYLHPGLTSYLFNGLALEK
ncbi:retrovirus-related Pol polyprotein from transposon 412 [Trichonephila clavipes]|uniref:Retrovirus-related Pol polyprotein from transposon 412 n=1 Tax=Trichonephila clavipes TaxID=2585209 RepID=A0A8X6SMM8_TRICX|nr:retrovirus-related Pol polyprotein from transposon 412 [Trichonephila clavipes]